MLSLSKHDLRQRLTLVPRAALTRPAPQIEVEEDVVAHVELAAGRAQGRREAVELGQGDARSPGADDHRGDRDLQAAE